MPLELEAFAVDRAVHLHRELDLKECLVAETAHLLVSFVDET